MKRILLLSITLLLSVSASWAQTFIVNDDTGNACDAWWYDVGNDTSPLEGTLQEAIFRKNQGDAISRIEIQLASKSCGPQFRLTSGDVVIDGLGTFDFTATGGQTFLEIEANNVTIQGIDFTGAQDAVIIKGNNVTVQDVTFNNPTNSGVQIDGARNNVTIQNVTVLNSNRFGIQFNNYNGTGGVLDNVEIANSNEEGILVTGNNHSGLSISNSYVYGSGKYGISVENGTGVQISNSVVGIDKTGTVNANGQNQDKSPGAWAGVDSYGWAAARTNIEYGGIQLKQSEGFTISGNTVSGNDGHGIKILDSQGSSANKGVISGNKIGTSVDGLSAVGNFAEGISVENSRYVVIGGSTPAESNTISANGNRSVFVGGGSTVQADGAQTSNMHGHGVEIRNGNNNEVYGNRIGTDITGNTSGAGGEFGNHLNGIYVITSNNNIIGDLLQGNLVAGNGFAFEDVHTSDSNPGAGNYYFGVRHGIQVDQASNNTVRGNAIGYGLNQSSIPNSEDGISVIAYGSSAGNNTLEANIIGGSTFGIALQGSGVSGTQIIGNIIGATDASGSNANPVLEAGIKVQNESANSTVGTSANGNIVYGNPIGIEVISNAEGNDIQGNILACNDEGISLRTGGNLEYGTSGDLIKNTAEARPNMISGISPASGDRIDIYVADDCNGADACSANRQGKTWVASVTASTDNVYGKGGGYWEFDVSTVTGLTIDNAIVTATDGSDNTSEFSVCQDLVSCEAPTDVTITTLSTEICDGESVDIAYTVTFPTVDEENKAHEYELYKSPDYTTPVASNTTGASFTVTEEGWYRVLVYNPESQTACGLLSPDSVQVQVGTVPNTGNITAVAVSPFCEGTTDVEFELDAFTPGSSFKWGVVGATIGGAGTDNEEKVLIDFNTPGTGTIWVREISEQPFACPDPDSATFDFEVLANPIPVIDGTFGDVCNGDTQVYKVTNPGGSSYVWDVVGGTVTTFASSDSISVVWDVDGPGTVQVTETTANGCVGTSTVGNVNVNTLPAQRTLLDETPVCTLEDFNAVLNVTTPTTSTFDWTITGATPATATGTQNVLTAEEASEIIISIVETNALGCVSALPSEFTIPLNQRPTPGSIDIQPGLESCEADTITVSYTPSGAGATPIWSSTPTDYLVDNALDPLTGSSFRLVVAGDVTIKVAEESVEGCVTAPGDEQEVSFTMNPLPAAPIVSGPLSLQCADSASAQTYTIDNFNASSTYTWTFDKTKTSTVAPDGSSADITFGIQSYSITVRETTDKGCASAETKLSAQVVGCLFEADFVLDNNCFDASGMSFTNQSQGVTATTTYSWEFDFGGAGAATPATSTAENPLGIVYAAPGDYTVRLIINDVIDGVALADTADILVTVDPNPSIGGITGASEVCANDVDVVYNVAENPNYDYRWAVPAGLGSIANQSTDKDSTSINITGSGSHWIYVNATDRTSSCTASDSLEVTIKDLPLAGTWTRTDAGDDCEGTIATIEYNGEGDTFVWSLNPASDAILTPNGKTAEVELGKSLAVVSVYGISIDGCFDATSAYSDTLRPIAFPDTALVSISGPTEICEGTEFTLTASSTESGITYRWDQGAHTILSDLNLASVQAVPNATTGPVLVYASNQGCEAAPKLITITKYNLPSVPAVNGIRKVCELDTVQLTYKGDTTTYKYQWTVTEADSRKDLDIRHDTISFVVTEKEKWLSGGICDGIDLTLTIAYKTPNNIFGACDATYGNRIPVSFPAAKSNLDVDLLANGDVHGKICNILDGRMDKGGAARVSWDCSIDSVDLSATYAIYELQDPDKDGIYDTIPANHLRMFLEPTSHSAILDYSQAPMDENRKYNFYVEAQAINHFCGDTVNVDDNIEFLPVDTVNFDLVQKIEACLEDTLRVDVLNQGDIDYNTNYYWDGVDDYMGLSSAFDTVGVDPIFGDMSSFSFTEVDTIVHYYDSLVFNGTDWITERFDSVETIITIYLNPLEPQGYPVTTHLDSLREAFRDTVRSGFLGMNYFVYDNAQFGDTIHVRADPRYCALNENGAYDTVFVSMKATEVVSRPAGDIYAAITGDIRLKDQNFVYTPNQIWNASYDRFEGLDGMTIDQLNDVFALYDGLERDTTNGKYVFPKNTLPMETFMYTWGWVLDKDSISHKGITPYMGQGQEYFTTAPIPGYGLENIEYVMVTTQIDAQGRALCYDTARFDVEVLYNPWIPNAFSPNGDDDHDVFAIHNVELYPETKVQIFNRWGSLLLEIENYDNVNNVWDGTVDGKDATTGTYFYIVDFGGGIEEQAGAVSVIR